MISYELLAIIVTGIIQIIAISVSVFIFKKSNDTTKDQFDTQMKKNEKTEVMKQLIYFDDQFNKLAIEYNESPKQMPNCLRYANYWLLLLDRIAYMHLQELIDEKFFRFFILRFNIGRGFARWVQWIKGEQNIKQSFPSFFETFSTFDYDEDKLTLSHSFYYYAFKIDKDPTYNPDTDSSDPNKTKLPSDFFTSPLYESLRKDPI